MCIQASAMVAARRCTCVVPCTTNPSCALQPAGSTPDWVHLQATLCLGRHNWSGSRNSGDCHGCPGGHVWYGCNSLAIECPRHLRLAGAVPPVYLTPTTPVSWSVRECAGVGHHYLRRRRRQQQQLLQDGVQKADAWLHGDSDGEDSAVEERLFIEDGADGCWVTFAADAAGRRVLIGRGAFSKVSVLQRRRLLRLCRLHHTRPASPGSAPACCASDANGVNAHHFVYIRLCSVVEPSTARRF